MSVCELLACVFAFLRAAQLLACEMAAPLVSGWRNTVEIVLFDISNSLKPYPPGFLAYTSKMRPVIGFSEPAKLIEVSNRIPPTSHTIHFSICACCPRARAKLIFSVSFQCLRMIPEGNPLYSCLQCRRKYGHCGGARAGVR